MNQRGMRVEMDRGYISPDREKTESGRGGRRILHREFDPEVIWNY